jgi:predicted transcriptional regulator
MYDNLVFLPGILLLRYLPFTDLFPSRWVAPETQARLNRVATAGWSGPAEYLQQLVARYVDHAIWFRQELRESLAQLDSGEFPTREEVGARIEQMFHP